MDKVTAETLKLEQLTEMRLDPTLPNSLHFDCGQLIFGRWDPVVAQRVADAWNARHGVSR